MTRYKVILSKDFQKKSKFLESGYKRRIQNLIILLSSGIFEGLDIKEMEPKGKNTYRIRLGKYRIIYRKREDIYVILFIKIGSRGDIYK